MVVVAHSIGGLGREHAQPLYDDGLHDDPPLSVEHRDT